MKLIEYVKAYPRWTNRAEKSESTKGASHRTLRALHGQAFYSAFDKAFGLKSV